MRPCLKWSLIIGLFLAIAAGLGFGLGFGLKKEECSENSPTTSTSTQTPTQTPPIEAPSKPENDYSVQVRTNDGWVEGTFYNPNEKYPLPKLNNPHDSAIFLGIPYAKPPVNDLRWKSPENPAPWNNVRRAKKNGPLCGQVCHEPCGDIKEDCLYLNVFTPKDTLDSGRKTGVAIWFHGGAFAWGGGSSPLYDGRFVASKMDAVIVAVNYRLTALGFLTLPEREEGQESDSNFGFQDQRKAIKWVRENIHHFGGDPERITIYGQSAGAVSTTAHMVHPQSAEMIKRVIVHSNPMSIRFKENWEAKKQFVQFEKAAGCENQGVTCLRKKSMEDIVAAAKATPILVSNEALLAAMPFSPVIDNYIFKKQPYASQLDGEYPDKIDIISGSVEHESEIFIRAIWPEPISGAMYNIAMRLLMKNDEDKYKAVLDKYPPLCEKGAKTQITQKECEDLLCEIDIFQSVCDSIVNPIKKICENVVENACLQADAEHDDRLNVEEPGTAWIFTCPNKNWLSKSSRSPNAFAYQFRAPMPIDISKIGVDEKFGSYRSRPEIRIDGWSEYERCKDLSCHAADLSYTFEVESQFDCPAFEEQKPNLVQCTEGNLIPPELRKMERYFHRYWGNFIRNGDPNNASGAVYPKSFEEQVIEDGELPVWPTVQSSPSGSIVQFGYNIADDDDENCDIFTKDGKNCLVRSRTDFMKNDCEFWDSLDVYPA